MALIGPSPIETVGNCQYSGIRRGCGYDGMPLGAVGLLLAESVELLLGQAALEERAGVDAGGGVALDEDLVAAGRVVERRGRSG